MCLEGLMFLLALEGGGDVSVNTVCVIIVVKFTSELDPLPGGVLNINFNLFRQVGRVGWRGRKN